MCFCVSFIDTLTSLHPYCRGICITAPRMTADLRNALQLNLGDSLLLGAWGWDCTPPSVLLSPCPPLMGPPGGSTYAQGVAAWLQSSWFFSSSLGSFYKTGGFFAKRLDFLILDETTRTRKLEIEVPRVAVWGAELKVRFLLVWQSLPWCALPILPPTFVKLGKHSNADSPSLANAL